MSKQADKIHTKSSHRIFLALLEQSEFYYLSTSLRKTTKGKRSKQVFNKIFQ